MPTKYKESAVKVDRATKKVSVEHFYVKQLSQKKHLNCKRDNTKPKVKRKIRNELVRRGIRLLKFPKLILKMFAKPLSLSTKRGYN